MATSMGMPSVAGEDGHVRCGTAGGQRDAGELRRIDVDELRGREIAREQDAAGGISRLGACAPSSASSTCLSRSSRSSTRSASRASPVAFRFRALARKLSRHANPALLPAAIEPRAASTRSGSSSNSRCADMISRTVGAAVVASCDKARANGVAGTFEIGGFQSTPRPGFDDRKIRRL